MDVHKVVVETLTAGYGDQVTSVTHAKNGDTLIWIEDVLEPIRVVVGPPPDVILPDPLTAHANGVMLDIQSALILEQEKEVKG